MQHIGLIIHGITQGGAERIMSEMANFWVQNGLDVTLFTLDQRIDEDDAYWVHDDVQRVCLPWDVGGAEFYRDLKNNIKRVSAIRGGFRKSRPDVLIAFMPQVNIISVIAARLEGIPIIISERNNPVRDPLSISWRILRCLVYPFADKLVVQTKSIRRMFPWIFGKKCAVIPNFVRTMSLCELPPVKERDHVIVAVGRLREAKGFDVLISAFSKIRSRFPSWRVEIWGAGIEYDALQSLIDQQECVDCISLKGSSAVIEEKMAAASVFVLSSRYEGFPNVLCEAMACGLAVVSTDCVSGPGEIVEHGVNGLLVPVDDAPAMADALSHLLGDDGLRSRLGERASKIKQTHRISEIMKMWDAALIEVL